MTAPCMAVFWQRHGWVEIKIDGTWYTFDTNAADSLSPTLKTSWYMQKRTAMLNKYYRLKGNVDTLSGKEIKGMVNVEL